VISIQLHNRTESQTTELTQIVLNRALRGVFCTELEQTPCRRAIWEREQKADRLKSRLPWFGLGVVVLALAMTVLLPRFIVAFLSGCAVLGGVWTTITTGVEVCVQYRNDAWF
jgi:hypothetical protein